RTTIVINASAEQVWNKLTDFEHYANWNPFIVSSEGQALEGSYLTNTLQLEGQSPQIFRPQLIEVRNQQTLHWLGHFWWKGLFDGEHYFHLEALGHHQTRLIHGEHFSGLLVGLVWRWMKDRVKQGFVQMNEALKRQLEGERQGAISTEH
ncbi:MAG: SRPBCC domain-containing protein, partial [Bacteroidota bacterium]